MGLITRRRATPVPGSAARQGADRRVRPVRATGRRHDPARPNAPDALARWGAIGGKSGGRSRSSTVFQPRIHIPACSNSADRSPAAELRRWSSRFPHAPRDATRPMAIRRDQCRLRAVEILPQAISERSAEPGHPGSAPRRHRAAADRNAARAAGQNAESSQTAPAFGHHGRDRGQMRRTRCSLALARAFRNAALATMLARPTGGGWHAYLSGNGSWATGSNRIAAHGWPQRAVAGVSITPDRFDGVAGSPAPKDKDRPRRNPAASKGRISAHIAAPSSGVHGTQISRSSRTGNEASANRRFTVIDRQASRVPDPRGIMRVPGFSTQHRQPKPINAGTDRASWHSADWTARTHPIPPQPDPIHAKARCKGDLSTRIGHGSGQGSGAFADVDAPVPHGRAGSWHGQGYRDAR